MRFISEGDLYRLIVHSKLPAAERFEKWVFDEVLPTIRKTGGYGDQLAGLTKLTEQLCQVTAALVQTAAAITVAAEKITVAAERFTSATEKLISREATPDLPRLAPFSDEYNATARTF